MYARRFTAINELLTLKEFDTNFSGLHIQGLWHPRRIHYCDFPPARYILHSLSAGILMLYDRPSYTWWHCDDYARFTCRETAGVVQKLFDEFRHASDANIRTSSQRFISKAASYGIPEAVRMRLT